MKRISTILLLVCLNATLSAQKTTEVMTLGTFHFDFPNLDTKRVEREDQIDVLSPRFQKEIERIVDKVAKFKPTIIVIERSPGAQARTDLDYERYVQNNYELKRNEEEQIGFRLARRFGIAKLHCVDEWGNFTPKIDSLFSGKDSVGMQKFETYFRNNPDSLKRFTPALIFKKHGILAALRQANDEANIRKDMGNYLIGMFKYEDRENDFAGVDFETGRWFSRNLKIFRNIQRIHASPSDRILVIFGSGHLNLLNYLFDCSPEYKRVATNDFLK